MILVPDELKKKLLKTLEAHGHNELAKEVRVRGKHPLTKAELERYRLEAKDLFEDRGYDGNDIEIDEECAFSVGIHGVWVQAWVHVPLFERGK